ncbi:MAG: hypothetical protein E7081_01555 [Bacteroidales bacterium]|nr:hypothetical protein [Bacteroidales bacterium]
MQRQSNIELLRIVSMLLILVVHIDGASLGLPQPMGDIASMMARDWWRLVVESISIIGVNCFVLISGYFGIRSSWKGFLRFTTYCLFYSVAICALAGVFVALTGKFADKWSIDMMIESVMIYTHNDLWFVPAYLGLYLLAPFLNKSIESMTFKQYSISLGAFMLFNLYAGWFWGGNFNPTGYTILQLVMMYLIGRYIYRFIPQIKNLGLYATIAWVVFTGVILLNSLYNKSIVAFAYNSPFVVLASISFFMMFKSVVFTNKVINYCAASAFAVYLVHKNPLVWGQFKAVVESLWSQLSLPMFTIVAITIVLVVFVACVIIDQPRRYFMRLLKL